MATVRQTVPADISSASQPGPEVHAISAEDRQRAIDQRFEGLLRQVQANRTNDDVGLIRKAWDFCVQHHEGQMRACGEPYIIRPLEVAEVRAEMKLDATAIAPGLLHDAAEDTPATSEEIETSFGDQV